MSVLSDSSTPPDTRPDAPPPPHSSIKSLRPKKRCAYEKCPNSREGCDDRMCSWRNRPHFHPKRRSQRYCSKACAQLDAWTSGSKSQRIDFIRKFEISKDELAYRMQVLGQDATTIAEIFHKSPATVFRRAKAFGLKPSLIRRDYRAVWIPKDRVCFVLKVEPTRAADIEVIIKGILHEQRLQASTSLEVFDVAPLATAS